MIKGKRLKIYQLIGKYEEEEKKIQQNSWNAPFPTLIKDLEKSRILPYAIFQVVALHCFAS